jgi:GNAT superfamily N-acetyltransferase
MLAAAVITRHAQRLSLAIYDDDGVDAVFLALPAIIFDRLTGTILTRDRHREREFYMTYSIGPATIADVPHIVRHREQMFRDMGVPALFDEMSAAMESWLRHAIPSHTYRGWMAMADHGDVVGGGGLIVIPWPPGPISLDPRCGFVFNVYVEQAHRKQGLARRIMDAMHDHCRAEGIERMVLNASTFGQSLYEDMGYVLTSEPMMRIRL